MLIFQTTILNIQFLSLLSPTHTRVLGNTSGLQVWCCYAQRVNRGSERDLNETYQNSNTSVVLCLAVFHFPSSSQSIHDIRARVSERRTQMYVQFLNVIIIIYAAV